jgi:hypothetical protein
VVTAVASSRIELIAHGCVYSPNFQFADPTLADCS